MPDYQQGKIYKIYNKNNPERCYIGSTTQCLCERWRSHKETFKNNRKYTTAHRLFQDYGLENCIIELIESFPCTTKEELNGREGHWIRTLGSGCVNKMIMGRTRQQYRIDTKEHKREVDRVYREKNKDKRKNYYRLWKERLEKSNEIYECSSCNYKTKRKDTFNRHLRSNRHNIKTRNI